MGGEGLALRNAVPPRGTQFYAAGNYVALGVRQSAVSVYPETNCAMMPVRTCVPFGASGKPWAALSLIVRMRTWGDAQARFSAGHGLSVLCFIHLKGS